ncbi:hypothetical protein [Haloarchaeobius salinus]|uniref:hypothetical protein n=1 Tax=Haloarchaeobius salinus TaxID=1198298 RepID=UPI00210A53CB|nr:hypothetical protein [Haloarchaeobius salinus]
MVYQALFRLEGPKTIDESYGQGVDYGHGAGDLEESTHHVSVREAGRQYPEQKYVNHDTYRAVPEDFDKMADYDVDETTWFVTNHCTGHEVLPVLNDPPEGELCVEKIYSQGIPPQQFSIEPPDWPPSTPSDTSEWPCSTPTIIRISEDRFAVLLTSHPSIQSSVSERFTFSHST